LIKGYAKMLKVLKQNGFASIVEVIVTAVVFTVAAFGILTTVSMLRPQGMESYRKLEAAYHAKLREFPAHTHPEEFKAMFPNGLPDELRQEAEALEREFEVPLSQSGHIGHGLLQLLATVGVGAGTFYLGYKMGADTKEGLGMMLVWGGALLGLVGFVKFMIGAAHDWEE